MSKLPTDVRGEEAIKAFETFGFVLVRERGSHKILKKDGHRFLLSVPCHKGECLGQGLLRSLIRAADVSVSDFLAALTSTR
jgi:predicted RNA binding protein YcfA (HicA-like mRNA interferase family)